MRQTGKIAYKTCIWLGKSTIKREIEFLLIAALSNARSKKIDYKQ